MATESGDKAACYHLARTYEASSEYEKAVIFYTKAHALSSAIRLAKVLVLIRCAQIAFRIHKTLMETL